MPRKALILAAGLGTRLALLTQNKPKALVEWEGKTLLEHTVNKLKKSGFTEVIINIHHFADQVTDYVESNKRFGIHIEFSDEREKLLDTGGAIKHAGWFFDEHPFLVYNVDILSDIDLDNLYRFHLKHSPLATLAVKERVTSRSLLVGRDDLLAGWRDNRTGEQILIRKNEKKLYAIAFSGIHIVGPEIFHLFGPEDKFSIIDFYLGQAANQRILTYRHDRDHWLDMGKPESYNGA